jgi:hypothetical protein
MLTAVIVVVILMTPALLQSMFRLAPTDTQLANLAGTAALCVSTIATGAATDRFGIRRVSIVLLQFLVVATYGLYIGAERLPSLLVPLYILAGVGAGGAVLTPIVMVRAFPTAVRFTGVSFCFLRDLRWPNSPPRVLACASQPTQSGPLHRSRHDARTRSHPKSAQYAPV